MDQSILWMLIDLPHYPLAAGFGYIPLSLSCCALWYLHSTLCTKIADSHIYISNLHVGRISSNYSLPWVIPWIAIHYIWVVCLPACGYDPVMLLLRWSLLFCSHIIFSIFFQYPLLFSHRWFLADISVQKLYGTCNSISYTQGADSALNY